MTLTALAAAWVGGLLLGLGTALPTEVAAAWALGCAALWAAAVLRHRRGRAALAVGCAAAVLIVAGAWWGARAADVDPAAALAPLFGDDAVTLRGLVVTDPERDGAVYRFRLGALETPSTDGSRHPDGWRHPAGWRHVDGRVQVTAVPDAALTGARSAPHLRYGDRLTLRGPLEAPPVFDDFDYRDYLARQGVGAVMRFPSATLESTGGGSALRRGAYALRARLAASLDRSLPEPASAMARSLLLGQRRGLPDDVRQSFIATGTSHLLAISGLHVAIVLGAALGLGRALVGGARWALLLALIAIWLYAMVSGMSPSVTRAAVMGSTLLLGRALGREGASLPALAAAAALMAALDPRVLWNISFQLSFTAVTGLLLLAPPLEGWLLRCAARLTRRGGERGAGPEPASTAPNALVRAAATALAAGVAATVGTLPLVALAFERVSYLGIPVTLLALPALPMALALSGAAAGVGLVSTALGGALGWAAWAPLWYLLALADAAARLPGGLVAVGGVTPAMVWGYYAMLAGAALGLRLRGRVADMTELALGAGASAGAGANTGARRLRWAALALLLTAAAVWSAAIAAPDGRLAVTFLDVGQGDAVFVRTPSGRQLLIDGGPDQAALLRELGAVMPFWDRSVDVVLLTHPDADHLDGLVGVLERYDVGLVASNGMASGSSQFGAWERLTAARGPGGSALRVTVGAELRTGDGVRVRVLSPPPDLPDWTPDLRNNASVTLRVTYGAVSFLLPADIHALTEGALVSGGAPLRSTVLKAAHHGSQTSTSQPFLDAVSPEAAVISAGRDNPFGHPSPEVAARLEAAVGPGALYQTARHGRVTFTTDGKRLWVETER